MPEGQRSGGVGDGEGTGVGVLVGGISPVPRDDAKIVASVAIELDQGLVDRILHVDKRVVPLPPRLLTGQVGKARAGARKLAAVCENVVPFVSRIRL